MGGSNERRWDPEVARRVTSHLAAGIGARRPTSGQEAAAAAYCAEALGTAGTDDVDVVPILGASTFAWSQGFPIAAMLVGSLGSRRFPRLSAGLASVAAWAGYREERQRPTRLTRSFGTRSSQNVIARIEPSGEYQRTVCLMGHLDTSRSGLIFHPRFVPHLRTTVAFTSALAATAPLHPLAARIGLLRGLVAASRAAMAAMLGLLAERELRGVDVRGANDNASGCGIVVAAAAALAGHRLEGTRVVCLLTGCEESGLWGSHAFLDDNDTAGWTFLNFDGVGADAGLRWLPREGMTRKWGSDPTLMRLVDRVAAERPELGLSRSPHDAGLTYDATPVLARGERALTITAQDRTIPHYHQPTDTVENLAADGLERALELCRALVEAIDRGEAD